MIHGFLNTYKTKPDSIALTIDGASFSYKELFSLASSICKQLEKTNDELVGIYTDNNKYTYAGIIAILLSGKGFVPLNSNYPDDRIKSIIEQVGLKTLISCDVSSDRLYDISPTSTVISADKDPLGYDLNLTYTPAKDQIAYILFTSGSTGVPKGIPISFSNFDQLLSSSLERWSILESDRVLQAFELSFDISIGVTFMTWESGANLVVTPFDGITAINSYKTIMENEVTFVILPPSSISFLKKFKLLKDIKIPSVRTTLFIGEALLMEHIKNWQVGAVNSKIINTYGPTEATVWCFAYTTHPNTINESINGGCPIGKPMKETNYWIDYSKGHEEDQGELCLIGNQVFNGYIKNQEKTKEVLFKNELNQTLYRTGDIVVKNDFDDLVYINRIDNQIKINGFRVELGEIEHALRELCGTSKVISFTKEIMGSLTIQAVIEQSPSEISILKKNLGKRIPSYMMPRNIHFIDEMPINSSGKIDRNTIKSMFDNDN